MSRLIDADAFEKFIKEKYKDCESTDDIKDQVLFDLSYQPTAYDVEKVVEELQKEIEWAENHGKSIDFRKGRLSGLRTAIRISRNGGAT